ncbi:unnamed protein product [Malus baccata var. baccata]
MSDSSIIVLWSATPRPKLADLKYKMKMFVTDAFDCSLYVSVSSQIDASVAFHNPTTRTSVSTPPWWKNGNPKNPHGFKSETTTQEHTRSQQLSSTTDLQMLSVQPRDNNHELPV